MKTMNLVILAVVFAAIALSQSTTPEQASNQTQAVQQAQFIIRTDKTNYCVGEAPQYVIVGPATMAGMTIVWSSGIIKNGYMPPLPMVVEQNVSYSQRLAKRDGSSYWSGVGSVFPASQTGSWSRTATIGGQSVTANFNVNFCEPYSYGPHRTFLSPESGSILFNRLPSSSVEYINVVFEGGLDMSEIAGWRVIINNQNATEAVNNLPGFVREELFEDNIGPEPMRRFYPSATVIRIPYQVKYLQPGDNRVQVKIKLHTNLLLFASANYIVRTAQESAMKPPLALPEEELECRARITPGSALTNQYVDFLANGGDGTFWWEAPGSRYPAGAGEYFAATYDAAGAKTVLVRSGTQMCTVNINVTQGPQPVPQLAPLPAPRP